MGVSTLSTENPVSITNIFCLLGKPGAGRETILKNIMNRTEFIENNNIHRLVYGTTRPKNPYDIEGETYYFLTKEEFMNLDPDEIIESRSYDPFFDQEYYYFTLTSHIHFGYNYIGKISTFQYEELKKWAITMQLKMPIVRINLFPITINAPIFVREKRIMNKASTDEDVYKMCTKLISEKYEFNTVIKENSEIIDNMNPQSLIIDNSLMDKSNIVIICNKIENFIKKKIIMQGI